MIMSKQPMSIELVPPLSFSYLYIIYCVVSSLYLSLDFDLTKVNFPNNYVIT